MFCVYMPYENHPSSFTDYLNTLGEIQGLLDAHSHTDIFLIGDFNDFNCSSALTHLLDSFMSELDLVPSDLGFRDSITFTYECDRDGLYRSWIDHILCSSSCSSLVTNAFASHSGSNLSDHSPLYFPIQADCQPPTSLPPSTSLCPTVSHKVDWSNISADHAERYCNMVDQLLPSLSDEIVSCSGLDCSVHSGVLDSFAQSLVLCLHSCSLASFPCVSPPSSSHPRLPGWNDSARKLRDKSVFWHKVWVEAGCRSSGVLFAIERSAKSRFKYEVRRLKRKKDSLLRQRIASSFSSRRKDQFRREVRRLNHVRKPIAPYVDGISGAQNIANMFSSRFKCLFNKHSSSLRSDFLSSLCASLSNSMLLDTWFSEDDVYEAINQLHSGKADANGIVSEHLKLCSSVIALLLFLFFTAIVHHGHMPQILRDPTLVPVLKNNKDASVSGNYRPIALSSTLSKVLERLLLLKYSIFFNSSHLQFGFKAGYSTSLRTGTVKNIVSRYTHNGSPIFGCFLDATIIAFFFRNFWTVVSPLLFSIFCCPGIARRSVVFVGALVIPTPSVFQMAFVKVVSSRLYFLHYTWMICWLILLSVALVVIGIIYLLVVCVMLMTLFCLHPALLH